MDYAAIAEICHEANKAYCDIIGDHSQKHWIHCENWQRKSAIQGVKYKLDNPDATPDMQHEAWCESKIKDGWVFGPKKDSAAKRHPCLVPYKSLPLYQQTKDELFVAIVSVFK